MKSDRLTPPDSPIIALALPGCIDCCSVGGASVAIPCNLPVPVTHSEVTVCSAGHWKLIGSGVGVGTPARAGEHQISLEVGAPFSLVESADSATIPSQAAVYRCTAELAARSCDFIAMCITV